MTKYILSAVKILPPMPIPKNLQKYFDTTVSPDQFYLDLACLDEKDVDSLAHLVQQIHCEELAFISQLKALLKEDYDLHLTKQD